ATMKLGSSRGMDTKRPRGSERSKPCHKLQLTRRSQPSYPWPPEQAQSGVSKPYRTTVDVPVRGYGSALFYGSMAADGDLIIMGDADDSYDFSDLDAFVSKLDEGYDLVMGNRFLGGIAPDAMPWKNRYIGNPIL